MEPNGLAVPGGMPCGGRLGGIVPGSKLAGGRLSLMEPGGVPPMNMGTGSAERMLLERSWLLSCGPMMVA